MIASQSILCNINETSVKKHQLILFPCVCIIIENQHFTENTKQHSSFGTVKANQLRTVLKVRK